MDPLRGYCLCEAHTRQYKPRRSTVKFFFIPPNKVPPHLLCGRCAPEQVTRGGLVVSEESLDKGIVTFGDHCAVDLKTLRPGAVPLTVWSRIIPGS